MIDDLRIAIKTLYRPGDVVELRAFGPGGIRRVGRFPFGWELAKATEAENAVCDCYWTLNPTTLSPSPMTDGGTGTREGDIARRRWVLL